MTEVSEFPEYDEIMEKPWFQKMPPEHQQRILRERKQERDRWFDLGQSQRAADRTVVAFGAVLFLVVYMMAAGISWLSFFLGVFGGLVVGFSWLHSRAGMLLCPLISMAVYLLLIAVIGELDFSSFLTLIGVFPLGLLSAYIGSRFEVAAYE